MIAVIDYCKGNLKSVERGLQSVGGRAFITDSPRDILAADALVLPGVGSFADASETMLRTGQMQAIRSALAQGTPFLGICLGQHLLFRAGYEGMEQGASAEGLGCIEGTVFRMPEYDYNHTRYKIPHVGWNSVEFDTSCANPLLHKVSHGEYFYFTHSYIVPESSATVATTTHSVTFPSVIQAGEAIFGVQFHPEKSSDAGAQVLRNFLDIARQHRKG